jgi:hypothetical protein
MVKYGVQEVSTLGNCVVIIGMQPYPDTTIINVKKEFESTSPLELGSGR